MNEEIPVTNISLGKWESNPKDIKNLRQKYEALVVKTNNFTECGKIKCDCCLSSLSSPKEKNQIIFCRICLAGTHVKCHGRALAYSYTKDMRDYTCERCRYLIDNNIEEYDAVRCRFCDELKGIMIYCEKDLQPKRII